MIKNQIHENVNNLINLTNIQRFSLHDGPGIRTTVFLKGCSLRCPWCANPENLSPLPQTYIKDGVEGTYGKQMTTDEVFTEVMKDKIFYEGEGKDRGGVTFSGGECLLQDKELEPLWKRLKENDIHIAVETSLFVPDVSIAIKYIDLFIVDIKILDGERCKEVEKGVLNTYISNVEAVLKSGKDSIFRIPVIGSYTDDNSNQELVGKFLKERVSIYNNIKRIELIKEHNLGLSKYKSLHAADETFLVPTYLGVGNETMEEYKDRIIKSIDGAVPVEICKI